MASMHMEQDASEDTVCSAWLSDATAASLGTRAAGHTLTQQPLRLPCITTPAAVCVLVEEPPLLKQ